MIVSKITIGLTGGIATGKSALERFLRARDIPVLDADLVSREVMVPGTHALAAIIQRYGFDILNAQGSLNRKKLGQMVFQDVAERHWLEQLIHPLVRARMSEWRDANEQVKVLSIPLLFESGMTDLVDLVWVVSCTPAIQQLRLQQRDQLTAEEAQARIQAQMPLDQKVALADWVFENDYAPEQLAYQLDQALKSLPLEPR
jgi:dephospho-CoA kinase